MAPSASRDRSRSPRRPSNRDPTISKGLKWKTKAPASEDKESRDKYREREERDSREQRPRESRKDSDREIERGSKNKDTDSNSKDKAVPQTKTSTPAPAGNDSAAPGLNTASKFGPSIASKFGAKAAAKHIPTVSPTTTPSDPSNLSSTPTLSSTHQQTPFSSTAPKATGPMIIVTVNDRLGTKAQIPCLASDPIKLFKAMVAARIGRQPHEIMLKRQGERPFKDQLTLEDYGVCNGVQLDLELDTGD
ncbi:hypothetical protein MBLNU457_4368t1 [Dothideomycetes sp. NU457]